MTNNKKSPKFDFTMQTVLKKGSSIQFPTSPSSNNRPNFDNNFIPITIHGNNYFCTPETKVAIEKLKGKDGKYPRLNYNLVYFPLINHLSSVDNKKGFTSTNSVIENDTAILFPLVVNINSPWRHACDNTLQGENAGDYVCAEPLGRMIFTKDIKVSPFPAAHEDVAFVGEHYFIPVLSSNLAITYLATPNRDAVVLYFEELAKIQALPDVQEFFIGVDALPVPIDAWHCDVCLFNTMIKDGKTLLKGIRFVKNAKVA
jgi:hypothetical protein